MAGSSIDFTKKAASDVIAEPYLDAFKAAHAYFYQAMVHLNVNILVTERILDFPFSLFTVRERRVFFTYVVRNFGDMSILLVAKLATDNGRNVHTLVGLKNKLAHEYIKDEFKDAFQQALAASRFSAQTKQLLDKVRTLRTSRIAHFLLDEPVERVTIDEIKELRDALVGLIGMLSFNIDYAYLPMSYLSMPTLGRTEQPDIDDLLDYVATSSGLLRMPEEDPERWLYRKQALDDKDHEALNKYRTRFGLASV